MSFFIRPILKKLFSLREQKDSEMVKPFLEHLEDLRWTLFKIVITLCLAMVLSFAFRFQLMAVVQRPLHAITGLNASELLGLGPADSMTTSISLSFYAGIIISFPFLLYFMAGFVLPALTQQERFYVLPAIGVSFALFLSGVLFCFNLILPLTLNWLFYDQIRMHIKPSWTVGQYFSFATQFVLLFGLSFELPVVVFVLVKMGFLNAGILRRTRAYALIIILLFSAFVAPTPDPITLLIVAGPMVILYEICIWIAYIMDRRDQARLSRTDLPKP